MPLPKALGKAGEQIAADQQAADVDIAALYAEDLVDVTPPEVTPPEAPPEVPAAIAPMSPETPAPEGQLPVVGSPGDSPPPESDPSGVGPDFKKAFDLERHHRRKDQEKAAAEMADLRERFETLQASQRQIDELFAPEKTEDQKRQEAIAQWVQDEAKKIAEPIAWTTQEQVAQMKLEMSATMARMGHPDYDAVTGWTGNPAMPVNPEHPFGRYLLGSPVLVDQIVKAPNVGEAWYLAGQQWRLQQPGAMENEVERRVTAAKAEAEARVRAEEAAKYQAALAKISGGTPPGLPSLSAVPGSGQPGSAGVNLDAMDAHEVAASPEAQALLNRAVADIYAS